MARDRLRDPMTDRPNRRLGTVGNADLVKYLLEMLFDRVVTDTQFLGNTAIRISEHDGSKDIRLPGR